MFTQLSDKLLGSIKNLRGQGRLSEKNIEAVIKDIRMGLLEADVNFKVVKEFISRVKEKALGEDVIKSVTPDQQFTKIIFDELVDILGGGTGELNLTSGLSSVMLVGLQGVGKTTTCGKLALHLRKKLKRKPCLVPLDVYRPAAIDQLQTLGAQIGVPCFGSSAESSPPDILKEATQWAKDNNYDVMILDTAGRLQIDEALMGELKDLKQIAKPSEVLLVADAMLGQQSVNVAQGFHQDLELTGLVMTKMDGDARGGAALSIRHSVGVPIKLMGVGEKLTALEVFHPDRLASRILDRGDVVSLVEKAQEVFDEDEAKKAAEKMAKNKFTVEDFLKQLHMMKKMGGISSLMGMLPGMGQAMKQMKDQALPEDEMKKIEAMIGSMTKQERADHKILNGSRKIRIAKGSGQDIQKVNKFIKQFEQAQTMMAQMMNGGGGLGGLMGGGKGSRQAPTPAPPKKSRLSKRFGKPKIKI